MIKYSFFQKRVKEGATMAKEAPGRSILLFLQEHNRLQPIAIFAERSAQALPSPRGLEDETLLVLVFPLNELVHFLGKFLGRGLLYNLVLSLNRHHQYLLETNLVFPNRT